MSRVVFLIFIFLSVNMWGHINVSYDKFSYVNEPDVSFSVFANRENLGALHSTISKAHKTTNSSFLEEEEVAGLTSFNTLWKTDAINEAISLKVYGGSTYNFTIDWGDGSAVETISSGSALVSHQYLIAGQYSVKIDGVFPSFYVDPGSRSKLLEITQWGNIQWEVLNNAFTNCVNMVVSAIDSPDLSNATQLKGLFKGATSFTGGIANWDVSNITNMGDMFSDAVNFDEDLSSWDVGSVANMARMFKRATSFNGNIENWDLSAATDISNMLQGATSFDQNISAWNFNSLTQAYDMFKDSGLSKINYDNILIGWESNINTPNGINLGSVPAKYCSGKAAKFNLEVIGWVITDDGEDCRKFITLWKTDAANETINLDLVNGYTYNFTIDWGDGSAVETITSTNPTHTYTTAGEHTIMIGGVFPALSIEITSRPKLKEIAQWGDIQWETFQEAFSGCSIMELTATDTPNLSNVTDMSSMFAAATSFKGDLSSWDVGNVTNMDYLFAGTDLFNGNISSWNVSNVTSMYRMFSVAHGFNRDLPNWDVSNVANMSKMFTGASTFNGDVSSWDVSSVTNMSGIFSYAISFNGNLSSWDVSNVTNMSGVFNSAASFNGDISGWVVSNVTDMSDMFKLATSFNGNVSSWNVANVTNMSGVFTSTASFNGDISSWNVSNVTSMSNMFGSATSFNGDISNWDVGNVTNMGFMFDNTLAFNGDMSSWNVSNVTNMYYMFRKAKSFNRNLSTWNVSNVTNMTSMFHDAVIFNGDISSWNVSNVTSMSSMFKGSVSFNSNLSAWNIGNVTTLREMYRNATSFNGNLSAWNLDKVSDVNFMFENSGISKINYDTILIGWEANANTPAGLNLGYVPANYCSGKAAKLALVANGWTIADDGEDCKKFITQWKTDTDAETIGLILDGAYTYNFTIDWGDSSAVETLTNTNPTHTYTTAGKYTIMIGGIFPALSIDAASRSKLKEITQWGDIQWELFASAFEDCTAMQLTASDVPKLANVVNMNKMFKNATTFNADLSSWDVSNITGMISLFDGATSFNGDISTWKLDQVTSMGAMFNNATDFNGDISAWKFPGVNQLGGVFSGASAFNSDLSDWDVSAVLDFGSMFFGASSFNSDISTWDISAGMSVTEMFNGAGSFNQNLGSWDLSSVFAITDMFKDSGLSKTNYDTILIGWEANTNTPVGLDLGSVPAYFCKGKIAKLALEANSWVFSDLGEGCLPFNTLWKTDTANETIGLNLNGAYAYNFTIDWGDGNNETITTINPSHVYAVAGEYTIKIGGVFPALSIDIASRSKLIRVEQWGDIQWESFDYAFEDCTAMQLTATDTPDLSNVRFMSSVFKGATSFNGNLSSWDVSSVSNMISMFEGATSFNGDLSTWDVSSVDTMVSMFKGATSFSNDISAWNVNSVTDMSSMFSGATSFDQDLSSWRFSLVGTILDMFNNSGITKETYDNFLIGIAGNLTIQSGLNIGSVPAYYCEGEVARNALIVNKSWTITDLGKQCAPKVTTIAAAVVSSKTYKIGEEVLFSLAFDQNITASGDLELPVTIGATQKMFSLQADVTNSNILVFSYTIVEGEEDLDGVLVGDTINLNGGSLVSATNVTENADLDLSAASLQFGLQMVDGIKPVPVITGLTTATDTGVYNNDGITNNSMPVFKGTTEAHATVYLFDVLDDEASIATAIADASGHWEAALTTALVEGVYSIGIWSKDIVINYGTGAFTYNLEIDTTAPEIPTVDLSAETDKGISDNDDLTSEELKFVGQAEKESFVALTQYVIDESDVDEDAIVSDENGNWEEVFTGVPDGVYNLFVTGFDLAGNVGENTNITVTVDNNIALESTTPANNAIAVSVLPMLQFNFDKEVFSGTGKIAIIKVSDNTTVQEIDITSANVAFSDALATLTISSSLEVSTAYKVIVSEGVFENKAGGKFAGTTFNFTTQDKLVPTLDFEDIDTTYGADAISLTATATSSTAISYEIVGDANGSVVNADQFLVGNVGSVVLKATSLEDDLYVSASKTITINIAKATLLVTANNITRNYQADNPLFTFSYEGFKNGDTTDDIDELPVATTIADMHFLEGTCDIKVSEGVATNYELVVQDGLLVIKPLLGEVATLNNAEVDGVSVTVEGQILQTGGAVDYSTGIVYSYKNIIPSSSDEGSMYNGDSTDLYSISLDGVAEATQYYYRAYITNATGTFYGDVKQFFSGNIAGIFKKKYGFSPNGDGINDTLFIDDLDEYPNNLISVYNRSGKLVYQKKGYDNSWTGTSSEVSSGSKLPVGAYLLLLDLNDGKTTPIQAWVFINY